MTDCLVTKHSENARKNIQSQVIAPCPSHSIAISNRFFSHADPLTRLDSVVDWAVFTPILSRLPKAEPKGPGGRPSFEPGLMFKVLVIQNLYGLSGHQTEFQIADRMSFKRFLGLSDADKAPDERTIWAFRDALSRAGIFESLFAALGRALESMGMVARKGQMIDASFVELPRQLNSREENGLTQSGGIPGSWENEPGKAHSV